MRPYIAKSTRLATLLSAVALSFFVVHAVHATDLKTLPTAKKAGTGHLKNRRFTIRVAEGDWGNTTPADIEPLLNAVAENLLTHFPGRRIDPILVTPSRRDPVVLYKKGANGEYQVQLAARDNHWEEFIYEFSHELMHILVNYQYHAPPRSSEHQWFEEALCETTSLYTLKQLSSDWEQSSPQMEWVRYAPAVREYLMQILREPHRSLPPDMTLGQWLQQNESLLDGSPYLRDKDDVVANAFLSLLERNQNWDALAFLNSDSIEERKDFHHHLLFWYRQTPPLQREFVRRVLQAFDFEVPQELVSAQAEPNS